MIFNAFFGMSIVHFEAVTFPLTVSAVADVHFLRFKQVFIVSSLPTALYDFHIHSFTHTHKHPLSSESQFRRQKTLTISTCFACIPTHILFHSYAHFHIPHHCFMICLFLTTFFAHKNGKSSEREKNISHITQCVFYKWIVAWKGVKQPNKWTKMEKDNKRNGYERLRLWCVPLYLIVVSASMTKKRDVQTCTSTVQTNIFYICFN